MEKYIPPALRNSTRINTNTSSSKKVDDLKKVEDLKVNQIVDGSVSSLYKNSIIYVNLENYKYENRNYSATIYNKSGITLKYIKNQKIKVKIVNVNYDSKKKRYYIHLKQILDKNILVLDLNGILLKRIRYEKECLDEIYPNFDSFLKYCCDKFHVILWSCCKESNINTNLFINYDIMRILNQDHAENCFPRYSVVSKEKPLFLKNISKMEEIFCDIDLKNRVLFVDDHKEKFEKNLSGTSLIFENKNTETFLNDDGLLRTILSKYENTENNIVDISNSLKDTQFNQFINFSSLIEIDKDIFPSIRAENLHRKNFKDVLKDDYLVCEKTDGIRFLLYITNKRIFLIDRSKKMFELNSDSNNFFDLFESDTRIDGELVLKYTENSSELIFLIFDIICINGIDSEQYETTQFSNESCTSSSNISFGLNYRIKKFNDYCGSMINDFNLNFFDTDNLPNSLKSIISDENNNIINNNIKLIIKKFYEVREIQSLTDNILSEKNELWFKENDTKTRCDGLVFTPKYLPIKELETVWKWKPSQFQTIDFLLKKDDFFNECEYYLNEDSDIKNLKDLYVGNPKKEMYMLQQIQIKENTEIWNNINDFFSSTKQEYVIIECTLNEVLHVRYDKTYPNSLQTAWNINKCIAENIEQSELCKFVEKNTI